MLMALALMLFYIVVCGCLSWYDWRTHILPDRLTCPLLWGGLLFNVFCLPDALSDAVLGAVAGYGFFAGFYWLYRFLRGNEGLGYGDVKLLAALGAWHGWQSLSAIILIASTCGLIIAGLLLWRNPNRHKKTPLPFGPFLVAAGFCVSWLTFTPPVMRLLNSVL
ncbi:A24 family peptidase [Atlantibacter subterranea]|uniref:A24 family peptidase n=1 Tax=Atlantibacter subterraneus TaxID=255519 RepID=A0ABU4E235_9ENTR|nr:A24 family peptidase [Atlantibacter subterranea]MDV7022381.1 A24 family peptidase [Atlantibacter subterranea]MDZ5665274.1 A24 family peptidase [Atlantibacter hermannii]